MTTPRTQPRRARFTKAFLQSLAPPSQGRDYMSGPARLYCYEEPLFTGITTVLTRSDSRATEALKEICLHANATTTPKQRAYIRQSSRPAAELAVEIGVSETTIRRWRARDTVHDRLPTPHRLATTLNPMQEWWSSCAHSCCCH